MTKPLMLGMTPQDLAREGLSTDVQAWEDGLRTEMGPGWFEWWYFDAHLDNGATVVIVFATKPILERNGPLKPVVLLTLTCPTGERISRAAFFPADQFHASRECCQVAIGPHSVQGDLHTYHVHVEMPAEAKSNSSPITIDLTFQGLLRPWRPGTGKVYFGNTKQHFAWLPAMPHGQVQGIIECNGKTQPVSGIGYHDHNWGNIGLDEVMDHWYWGRAQVGEYTLIYAEQMTARSYGYARIPVFLLAKGSQVLVEDASHLTMKASHFVSHPGGRSWPREIDFYWQAAKDKIHISLRQPKIIEAINLLKSLPPWKRFLLRLVANPYYFRFQAELVLSVHWGGVHATERGSALYELMILQGRKHP